MDDDCKEYRRNKPQQKFYKPGSGPLRRSCYGLDTKMDSNDIDNGSRRYRTHYGSHYSVNDDVSDAYSEKSVSNSRQSQKKLDQQLYVPRSGDSFSDNDRQSKASKRYDNSSHYSNKNLNNLDKHGSTCGSVDFRSGPKRDRSYGEHHSKDGPGVNVNYNRHYRQASETRSISPTHCVQERKAMDHNRDSRSMETTTGCQMTSKGGKPPSGRRNSAGYMSDNSRHKYMVNIDNVPPRFRKKFLEHSGQNSFDNVDQVHKDKSSQSLQSNYSEYTHNPASNWSQTLPSRGRGRLRDNENFDKEKFINNYLRSSDAHGSGRSTHSNSYMNLYESSATDQRFKSEHSNNISTSVENAKEVVDAPNGITNVSNTSEQKETQKQDSDAENDSETVSQISNAMDFINLDWTEEVEKHIKLDDVSDTSISFSQSSKVSKAEEIKPVQPKEEAKRSGRSRRKDRRSSSRGLRNSEKRERNRKDSMTSIQHEPERLRKDSNVSIQHETISGSLRHKERERRDSHRSNRSSTIGNSRDDLDRWRSLRSYSREQSAEGRIVSQCNSRDVSSNRALSPRDNEGFRVPSNPHKTTNWPSGNQKKNNASGPRTSSIERGRHTPSEGDGGVGAAGPSGAGGGEGGGGARRSRRGAGRRRARYTDGHGLAAAASGHTASSTPTNWREEILESKRHPEGGYQSNRLNSTLSEKSEISTSHPGLIMLPQGSISHMQKELGRSGPLESKSKTLYDHQNPSRPIIVQTSPTKTDMRLERGSKEMSSRMFSNYDNNEAARAVRHRALLQEVERADVILQAHMLKSPVMLADHWSDLTDIRTFLQNALQKLLMSDLKYCQEDNVEHHFWKMLYHNFIESLRKSFPQVPPEEKPKIVKLINTIIDEGNTYFENLVQILEKAYKFNVDDYINDNHVIPPKGLGYVGLALISVQKLYVSLGDLARYKEQVNETNNYAKSKLWYTKAQQINPKNGRPYNQLAILAIYARRKLDAVYYYMRSLMSSNPFQSARESLLSLFDENRKKYEAAERKRRAALESLKVVESSDGGGSATDGTTASPAVAGTTGRHELWVRPGERPVTVQRVTSDPLTTVSSVELNKNFITSYLHVHGKLITKIGMETFHESASLMLRQFRELLHRQPLPMPAARLLQLTALNMFAVETTASSLKGGNSGGERSAWLECALSVSILMFGALVERCCALLPEQINSQHYADALLLLPAIKVWSDWMLCHSSVWNPPPPFDNFNIDNENDPWDWLAKLMNILEALDDKAIELENDIKEGYICVRLAEDSTLGGFTPLMYIEPAIAWVRADPTYHQAAEHALRTRKLLFFGTEYLVGVEPPVLRLEYPADSPPRYASAVQRAQPNHPPLQHLMEELEEGDSTNEVTSGVISPSEGVDREAEGADEATRRLLRRKEQLETRKATLERHKQRMQEILQSGSTITEVVVRPKWLVPDTNCFIDHLPLLQAVVAAPAQPYTLAVPLVVMTELEGLRKCSRVGGAAHSALEWVSRGGGASCVRLVTSRGSLLASRAFTAERDHERVTNDDRVLATALNLYANLAADTEIRLEDGGGDSSKNVRRVREVVLLTDDRNLRVKALAAELPTRDLPSFVQWAGLGLDTKKTQASPQGDTTAAC